MFALSLSTTDANTLSEGRADAAVQVFFNHLAEILLTVALPLAFIAIVFAAYKLIVAQGNPDAYKNAKNVMMYVLLGIFFVVFAAIIVRFLYNLIKV